MHAHFAKSAALAKHQKDEGNGGRYVVVSQKVQVHWR